MRKIRLQAWWDSLRSSYWFVPSAMTAAAIALALLSLWADQRLGSQVGDTLGWVYAGGAAGARAVLSTIAGSMITVAGVVFSVTIVSLTLASQQFGPRMLRGFMRDTGNQIVLGTFVATFVYSLLVLRTVRGQDGSLFVPHLSVTIGVGLALFSLGVLIYFIHHVATSIRAAHIVDNVGRELLQTVRRVLPEERSDASKAAFEIEPQLRPSGEPALIAAPDGGYVQAVDEGALVEMAAEHDLVVELLRSPGEFSPSRACIARVWPRGRVTDEVRDAFEDAFVLGVQRTTQQDLMFAVDQVVEIGVRSLSPSINDPWTAMLCIDRLTEGLVEAAVRQYPPAIHCDDKGVARVFSRPISFEELLAKAFYDLRRYGATSTVTMLRLLEAHGEVLQHVHRAEHRAALLQHLGEVGRVAMAAASNEEDRRRLDEVYRRVYQAAVTPAES